MTASEWAAWLGAATGTLSFVWNIYLKMSAGVKLEVSARAGMVIVLPPPGKPKLIAITVQNVGTVPTTLTNASFHIYPSKRAAKKQNAEDSFVIGQFFGQQKYPFPFRLEVGSEWCGQFQQDSHFDELLATDKLWFAVYHSFSKQPRQVKVALPPKYLRGPAKRMGTETVLQKAPLPPQE